MRLNLQRGGTVFVTALFLFFLLSALTVGVFAWRDRAPWVRMELTYYLLVRDCDSATVGAVAGESYLAGGAGFYWEKEDAVVLACYYAESDATQIAHTMSATGVSVRVIEAEFPAFRLAEEGEVSLAESNIKTADSCARLLYETANGLERGDLTQAEARAAVEGAFSALSGLAAENGARFSVWNSAVKQAARRLGELQYSLLFPKDLRYLQVFIVAMILDAKSYFA